MFKKFDCASALDTVSPGLPSVDSPHENPINEYYSSLFIDPALFYVMPNGASLKQK